METEDETEVPADVSASKLQTNAVIESSSAEDDDHDAEELPSIQFVKSLYFKRLIQLSIVVSAISVAMNTRQTFKQHHELWYLTLILDILVLALLAIESFMDMKILGLWKGNLAFFRNRVNLFNLAMVIFIAMSVILQIIENSSFPVIPVYVQILVRAPRALILLRVMKYFMNYSLLSQVSRRSGKQIRNVTIFLLYFMILASLIGLQLFGEKAYYCVKNATNVQNVTYKDLTIPEIRCGSPKNRFYKEGGATCPPSFVCRQLEFAKFNQNTLYFETIWDSFLTVYESSTQEGWVLVMYAEMNSYNRYVSAIYFVSLIFFVAWLVKSVFIAVITETFADLRSQLYLKNWRNNRRVTGLSSEIIQDDGSGWHLVAIKEDHSSKTKVLNHRFHRARQFLASKYFRFMIWTLLSVEALVQVIVLQKKQRYIIQLVFVIIFGLESLFKIWCVGLKSYWKIPVYRFELFLAVCSSLCIAPVMNDLSIWGAFQVLRVTRLIIAVPSLYAFLYRAFGTGTKLGAVVIFTIFFLVFASILSLQLFSGMDFAGEDDPFDNCLKSATSMFQIITQEGWVEVLDTVKYASSKTAAPFVSIYFTIYNLFASLILGSVFIAVILDNLEIKEETKILKQRKLDEEVLNIQETLPRRLRVFEKFKEKPRLVETRKVSGDFIVPKVRQSFMRKFLDDSRTRLLQLATNPSVYEDALLTQCNDLPFKLLSSPAPEDTHTLTLKKRSSLTQLIQDSTRRRNLGDHAVKYTRHSAKSYVLGYTARQINRNAAKLTQGARKTSERADMNAVTRMRSPRESVQATLPHSTSVTRGNEDWNIRELRARREQAQRVKEAHEESLRENHPYFDFPLFLVSRDSQVRHWLQRIVHARYEPFGIYGEVQSKRPMFNDAWIKRILSTQTYLEWMIIFITLSSCLAMMREDDEKRTSNVPGLAFFEYLFVIATSLELVIRILADGFLFTPNAIIRDYGDVIDISIYIIGFIYLCWSPVFIPQGSPAQALLILRALRPLRIINLIPKMRQVIQELFGGFKEILKAAALQLSLMFIFASYGVQMFSDKLGKCNDPDLPNATKEQCHGVFYITLKGSHELRGLAGKKNQMLVTRVWKNPKNFNFDDIQHALLALFEALSLEGWLDIRNVIEEEKSLGTIYGFYIHGYILLGCMIGLALFVGVVVNNFNENKGTALLTVDQRRWEDLRKRLRLAQPLHLPLRPDDNAIRSRLYDLTQSSYYRRFIVCLVVLNCGTLAVVPWSDQQAWFKPTILMFISAAFTVLFVADCILQIIAVTFMGYWRSHRNRFDFILTLAGILWIILFFAFLGKKSYGYFTTVWLGVVIILFRFLSLSGKHDTLKMLMMTVYMSLVKSFYIIFVLLLIIMSYALIGVIMFGAVKYGVAINKDANFKGSINAMILLFRITTGEDWNKIMHDCMIQTPYCTEAGDGDNYWQSDCGSVPAALCYFISFYVILTFILLNLLIAVIIENFSLFYSSEEDAALSNHDLYQYQLTWNLVDQNRKGFITVRQARLILRLLRGRLGVDPSSFLYKHICLEIEKLRGGREVSFHDLLEILAYRSIDDISRSLQLEELLAREELERSIEEEVAIQTIRDWFLGLRKQKVKMSRGFSFGASSASSVESMSSDSDDEQQPNRLSVKNFQKRSVTSKSGTPTVSVNEKTNKNKDKESNENGLDEKELEDQSTLDAWFTDQLMS